MNVQPDPSSPDHPSQDQIPKRSLRHHAALFALWLGLVLTVLWIAAIAWEAVALVSAAHLF